MTTTSGASTSFFQCVILSFSGRYIVTPNAGPRGMTPNAEFLAVVEALYPKDARLVLGCRSGQRSMRAADVLSGAGYTGLVAKRATAPQALVVRSGYILTRTTVAARTSRRTAGQGSAIPHARRTSSAHFRRPLSVYRVRKSIRAS